MKFSINQESLNEVLGIVNKGVSPRAIQPALAGIFIQAEENEVSFRSTDLELSISATAPALIEEDGSALLPAKLLLDIVSTLPDEAVNIETNQEQAEIICGNSKFNIRVLNAVDYPEFPTVEANEKVTLPFVNLSKMVKKVAKMAARDDSRPILQGVNVKVNANNLELVATDAYRIAISKSQIETENTSQFEAVIPGSFLMDIAGIRGDIQNATISLSENQVVVQCNDYVFINRRIAGNFPNYEQLLPDESMISVNVKTKDLSNAVRRIAVLSGIAPVVKLSFDKNSGNISLSGSAQDVGSCDEKIVAEYSPESNAEKFEICFNCSYVLDGLSCFDNDEIKLEFVSDSKPGIFKDTSSDNTIYILLPVKLS